MDRTIFYQKTIVDNTEEFDYLYNSLSNFKTNYPVNYYRVSDVDLMRPDLISYQWYGTVDYWWIICYVNKIHNPLEDLVIGRILIIPNILDIYEFSKRYSQ